MILFNTATVARIAGVSPELLRAAERAGVIPAPSRMANGWRAYSEADIAAILAWRAAVAQGRAQKEGSDTSN